MEPHQERVVEEQKQLDEKIIKLQAFVSGEKFKSVDVIEQGLLVKQLNIMVDYNTVLHDRIERFKTLTAHSSTS